jgi:hypothetical protein
MSLESDSRRKCRHPARRLAEFHLTRLNLKFSMMTGTIGS